MAQEVKFLDMFGCCAALRDKCGGLELAKVKNVVVSREKRTMDIAAGFAAPRHAPPISPCSNGALRRNTGLRG